ncbi:caspase activity and apoptosis inhibitor 1 [Patella vulgata]|uniref:caspase activity and apoptosis inhibitor 1 n=1 Tax=Patella vulgata TaxID=6465 RepID=UPI00217FCD82|nr:caspase activity and apoptosis inhibitor 1 [Patella vulgata]
MSAAKMVADSTQSDEPLTKKHKITLKKNKKNKRNTDKKTAKKAAVKEGSYDPLLDLSRDVRPIKDYCHNRCEMLDEMFQSVKGSSFTMILPDVLRDMEIKELKHQCLEQLEVMSKKRICRILAGDEPDNISSSGTEDELEVSVVDDMKSGAADSTSILYTETNAKEDIFTTDCCDSENSTDKDTTSKPLDDSSSSNQIDLISVDDIKVEPGLEATVKDPIPGVSEIKSDTNINNESSDIIPMLTQNHMELLELEMRARAIKAMLRAQESQS